MIDPTNSDENGHLLAIACAGNFVDKDGERWNGSLTIFLRDGRTETYILSVKARTIGCLGCPNPVEKNIVS